MKAINICSDLYLWLIEKYQMIFQAWIFY